MNTYKLMVCIQRAIILKYVSEESDHAIIEMLVILSKK
jgi:hypothetical protein